MVENWRAERRVSGGRVEIVTVHFGRPVTVVTIDAGSDICVWDAAVALSPRTPNLSASRGGPMDHDRRPRRC